MILRSFEKLGEYKLIDEVSVLWTNIPHVQGVCLYGDKEHLWCSSALNVVLTVISSASPSRLSPARSCACWVGVWIILPSSSNRWTRFPTYANLMKVNHPEKIVSRMPWSETSGENRIWKYCSLSQYNFSFDLGIIPPFSSKVFL